MSYKTLFINLTLVRNSESTLIKRIDINTIQASPELISIRLVRIANKQLVHKYCKDIS